MKKLLQGAAFCLAMMTAMEISHAGEPSGGLKQNQTAGYGAGKLLTFTYMQNFDCVDEPNDDLDFNKTKAKADPNEMQIPICQAGINPAINPPGQSGRATKTTEPLYVLIPMFSADNDTNPDDAISCDGVVPGTICGNALGQALIKFFGALPEGFKAKPLVYTQCPDPGLPPGTCTMHSSRVDLAPVLAALGYIGNPPTANVFVPSPNHSHVLPDADINFPAVWWQVLPVLVLAQSDWPSKDGKSGITSVKALKAAEKAGQAIEVPSNFFLFFDSQQMSMGDMKMESRP